MEQSAKMIELSNTFYTVWDLILWNCVGNPIIILIWSNIQSKSLETM
jgi:hypothetical protein